MDYLQKVLQICNDYSIGVLTQSEALHHIATEFIKASGDDTENGRIAIVDLQVALKLIL